MRIVIVYFAAAFSLFSSFATAQVGDYGSELSADRCQFFNKENFGAFTGTVSSAPDYETAASKPEAEENTDEDVGAIPDSIAAIIAEANKQAAEYNEGRSLRFRPEDPGRDVSFKERFVNSPHLTKEERAALYVAKAKAAMLTAEQTARDVARGYGE
jgi:cell pole-organizing protein PopZ